MPSLECRRRRLWNLDGIAGDGHGPAQVSAGHDDRHHTLRDSAGRAPSSSSTGSTPPRPIHTYDANGNQLSAGGQPFTYDLANRLKTMTQGATTTTYTYYGDGKRLQTSTGTTASAKTNFLWDVNHSLPQVALERNGNNVLQRQYIYGLKRIRQNLGAGASYYLYDGLGSVVNTTAPLGALQKTYSYEPYGTIRTESGTSPTNFFHFTSEYRDPTGLYHLRARQYDPATGRFLSRDPLEPTPTAPSISAYAYADDRPTVFVDPSGHGVVEPRFEGKWSARLASSTIPGILNLTRLARPHLPSGPSSPEEASVLRPFQTTRRTIAVGPTRHHHRTSRTADLESRQESSARSAFLVTR